MSHMTAEASQAFLRRVILPLAGLVVVLMLSAVGGIVWIAGYQTDVAIAQQVRLATGALRIQADKLGTSAGDYGYWDDAVSAIVDKPDLAWIADNIGAGAEKSLGVGMSFVLDLHGKPLYSRIGGVDGAEDPARFFPQGFVEAHAAWKKLPHGRTYSGVVPYGNSAILIAIAPVRAWQDASRPPTGYSLLFVQLLDGPMLEILSRDYELAALRIAQSDAMITDPRATLSIRDGVGRTVSRLAWDPSRPGDDLLRIALPFLAIFLLTLTALGAFVVRHAIGSAQLIVDREKKAFRDPLTGLANRALFFAEVDKALRRLGPAKSSPAKSSSGKPVAGKSPVPVMYVDLDGFKLVNDTMGHGAGDVLLQQVAARLADCTRADDLVARLGGDEFAVLFTSPIGEAELKDIGERILQAVAMDYQLPAGPTRISCSIGIAAGRDPEEGAFDLIERADTALYRAKAAGRNRLEFHDEPATTKADLDAA